MSISYDPTKNQQNIEERGLSFDLVTELDWDTAWIYEDERNDYGEARFAAYSMLGERLHFICFSEIEKGIRVISFRKANRREVKRYEQQTHN
ncbi:MAG: hypothetical protein COA71_01135 [SAR86 cluster bacterium]|uniref:BrnT family toxin n=1 Tax=SAR86 cluster bacterium TaxID=2030880 RepID=A0A2A5CHZ7_9GAMM|nr:BrnT family toxin [Gammaproteobacteria bacterium AH-315-E17]PCJ43507.1 MAG: hypothetical protein COA71_01135 [SAR86 cluster bacterium]